MRTPQLANANTGPQAPSEVVAHYLEAIYYMRAEGEAVRSARLADWLSVSRPTVTAGVGRVGGGGKGRVDGRQKKELAAPGEGAPPRGGRQHRIVARRVPPAPRGGLVGAGPGA